MRTAARAESGGRATQQRPDAWTKHLLPYLSRRIWVDTCVSSVVLGGAFVGLQTTEMLVSRSNEDVGAQESQSGP
jgi:hypothetical protein